MPVAHVRVLACLLGARLQLLIDLVNHSSSVLPFESRKEIRLLTPSNDGRLLVVLDVDGRALLVNLQRRVVLHRFNFKKKVHGAYSSSTLGLRYLWTGNVNV